VKEAIFNMLAAHYTTPAELPPISVADVFAGSGSLGLEALSRGAASCCFFERGRQALTTLRRNIAALQAESLATLVARDAWTSAVADPGGRPFDLILLDPPYRDSDDTSDSGPVAQYLRRLDLDRPQRPLIVLHHRASKVDRPHWPPGWRTIKHRTFGTNAVSFITR
jgi:16S rRNA (guanine966-N2)-methyltransferase